MEIFYSDIDRTFENRVTINNVDDLHPMINNGKIIYTQGDTRLGTSHIILHDLDGSNINNLTATRDEFGAIPVMSKSGKYYAYASWDLIKNTPTRPMIKILNNETNEEIVIGNPSADNWRPFFSNDESKLVYISNPDLNYDIFIYDLLTKSTERLTQTNYDEWDPCFSLDDSSILFSAYAFGNWDLFEVDLYSKVTQQITFTRGDEWDPFYVDNHKIMFSGSFGPFRCIHLKEIKIK